MRWRRWSLILLLLSLSACQTTEPRQTARLTLSLTTPRQDTGALLIRIVGGAVEDVTSNGSQIVVSGDEDDLHLLLVGDLGTGPLATIAIPDHRLATGYLAVVEQASRRDSFTLLDPADFVLTLTAEGPQ